MMWCFRMLVFAVVLFSGRVLGRVTVPVPEIPDAVYLTTTITVYDGTVTPTGSVETSRSFSDIPSLSPTPSSHPPPLHSPAPVPLPGFIPLPLPAKDVLSSSSRLSTFITHTISRTTTADSASSLTIAATSTSSAAPALKQSEVPPPPSSTDSTLSRGAVIGISTAGVFVVLAIWIYTVKSEECVTDFSRCSTCGHSCGAFCCYVVSCPYGILMFVFHAARRVVRGKSRKKQADAQGETTPVELDATNKIIGEPSAPETRPYSSHPPATILVTRELDGSSTASHQSLPMSQQHVELPTSADPGNSPLPRYEDLDTDGRNRVFSWAAPESAYRPDKLDL